MLLYDVIACGAANYPDRPAIFFHDEILTYGGLASRVNRCAAALRSAGIGRGDSVALLLGNCPEFTIAYYAATTLGAVCVPVNPLLKPAELEYIWGDSQARIVIAAPPVLENALAVRSVVGSLREVVVNGESSSGVRTFKELLEGMADEPVREDFNDREPAVCIYTSGTTGRPKGAVLSHRNLLTNCDQISRFLDFGERDRFLCVLPQFHSFAGTVCQNASLYAGSSTVLLEQFHPARILEQVERHRCTIFCGVPAMFGGLLQFPADRQYDFTSVRLCVSGGAPMPVALMHAFEAKFGSIILEGDGPTECGPVTCVNPLEGPRKPGTVGIALPGVEMKIVDDQDRELQVGEVGEIVVRGENVMLEYLNQPEQTAEAMKGGWYHTGDLGHVDADGYFSIVDRKKDMLLVGGLNVYPREIEEVLYTHPAIAEAAVIGLTDDLKGDLVTAVVVLKPGAEATARELTALCREKLANYKVPRKVIFRDAMPRGGTGKILKRLLVKELDLESPPPAGAST